MSEPAKVVTATIIPPMGFGQKARVECRFDTGEVKTVFTYFSDELSFVSSELEGLTEDECKELFTKKDIQYLQS
jgi:hypothetical protein